MCTVNEECSLGHKDGSKMHRGSGESQQTGCAVDVTIPLQRNWLTPSPRSLCSASDSEKGPSFRLVSYNILADCQTPEHIFPYCAREYFKDVQRFPQLMRELEHHDADIVCLQEVGREFYHDRLEPALRDRGYQGSYLDTDNHPAGLATFFKESCFELMEKHQLYLGKVFAEEVQGQDLKGIDTSYSSRALLVCRLRFRLSNKTLCLGNTHLSFLNYERIDITTLEASLAIRHLLRVAGGADRPHILCGDFNQEPHMPGYKVLHDGCLRDKDKEYLRTFPVLNENNEEKEKYLVDLLPDLFSHESRHLRSAYKSVVGHEVPFSNHEDINGTKQFPSHCNTIDEPNTSSAAPETPPKKKNKEKHLRRMYRSNPKNYGKEVFIAALDYFWFGSDSLQCNGVLEMIDESKIEQFHSAPNIVFPSDHLLMKAEFQFLS